jgi:hypothetical protein
MTAIGIHHESNAWRPAVSGTLQKTLFVSGLLSSLMYVAFDLVAASRYPGYSLVNQAISELSAIDAPAASTSLWKWLGPVYGILFMAFTIGVLRSGRGNRALRTSGWIMLAFIGWGMLWPFFPMHQRGTETTASDLGHLILGGGSNVLILGFIGFGAFALGKRFRNWSLATIAVFFLTAIGTFTYVNEIGAGDPTPWLGIIERVMIYAYLLWVAVLAMALLLRDREGGARVSRLHELPA